MLYRSEQDRTNGHFRLNGVTQVRWTSDGSGRCSRTSVGTINERSAFGTSQPTDAAGVAPAERPLLPAANGYFRPEAVGGEARFVARNQPVDMGSCGEHSGRRLVSDEVGSSRRQSKKAVPATCGQYWPDSNSPALGTAAFRPRVRSI